MNNINLVPKNKSLQSVSASQINTYLLGGRRWLLESFLSNREGETPEMRLGTWAHHKNELYLAGLPVIWTALAGINTDITRGSIERLFAHPLFPKPAQRDAAIEEPGNYAMDMKLAGIPVKGKIDYRNWSDPKNHLVLDHKTSGDLRYAKSPEDLAREPQLVIYSKYCLEQGATTVTAGHSSMQTKKSSDAKVVLTDPMDAKHINGLYEGELTTIAAEMGELAANYNGDPLSISCHSRSNTGKKACRAFNKPCAFIKFCGDDVPLALRQADDDFAFDVAVPPTPGATSSTMSSFREKLNATATPPPSGAVRATGINPPDGKKPAVPTPYVPPAQAEPAITETVSNKTTLLETLTLYINCVPTKGFADYIRLEDEIARRAEPILLKYGVTDIREIDFGKGTAELLASFKKEPLRGAVVATTHGLGGYVLEGLLPLAAVVIRGVS